MDPLILLMAGGAVLSSWVVLIAIVATSKPEWFPDGKVLAPLVTAFLLATVALPGWAYMGNVQAQASAENERTEALTAFIDHYQPTGRDIALDAFDPVEVWTYQFRSDFDTFLAVKLEAGWIETKVVLVDATSTTDR